MGHGWGLRLCISGKFPTDDGPKTTLGVALPFYRRDRTAEQGFYRALQVLAQCMFPHGSVRFKPGQEGGVGLP